VATDDVDTVGPALGSQCRLGWFGKVCSRDDLGGAEFAQVFLLPEAPGGCVNVEPETASSAIATGPTPPAAPAATPGPESRCQSVATQRYDAEVRRVAGGTDRRGLPGRESLRKSGEPSLKFTAE